MLSKLNDWLCKLFVYALSAIFILAFLGWVWFNVALGWAIIKAMFFFVVGG